jgi:hypothetical protein
MDFTRQFYKLHQYLHLAFAPSIEDWKEILLEGAGRHWVLATTRGGRRQAETRGAGRRRGSPDPQTLASGEHSARMDDNQIVRYWETSRGRHRARTRAAVSC